MVVRYSSDKTFKTYSHGHSRFGRQGVRHRATMTGLAHEHAVLRPGLHPAARPHAALEELQGVVLLDSCVASSGRVGHLTGAAVPEPVRHRVHPARPDAAAGSRHARGVARGAARHPASVAEAAKVAAVDAWFEPPAAHPRREVGDQRRHRQEGVGVRPRPRQLEHPAPDLLRALRARDDDRVLVEPHAHPRRARPRLGLPLRLRRHHPPARARAGSRTCSSPARCTRRCASTSTTGSRCGTSRTRTRAASCWSCTPSAAARATPRRWSRPRRCSSPATPWTGARPSTRSTTPTRTPPVRSRSSTSATPTPPPTARRRRWPT